MQTATLHRAQSWLIALKPASWLKLLFPVLLGQALGATRTGRFDPGGLAVALAYMIFSGAYIVLINDWGDQRVDRIKRRMYPTVGSPKTIPDGLLNAREVLLAGTVAATFAVISAAIGAWAWKQTDILALGVIGIALFASYTLPPLALNYRGGGELLEAMGVGLVLPYLSAKTQSPHTADPAWLSALGPFAVLALASAIASGLSDEQSDRAGGKVTFVTAFKNTAARRTIETLLPIAAVGSVLILPKALEIPIALAVATCIPIALAAVRLIAISPKAEQDAFREIALYKRFLHRGIRHYAAILTLAILLEAG